MNDHYLRLGRTIAGLCPPGFAKAVLEARMVEDEPPVLSLTTTEADGAEDFPHIDAAARDALAEALNAVRDGNGKTWSACTVTLTPGGGFAMDTD